MSPRPLVRITSSQPDEREPTGMTRVSGYVRHILILAMTMTASWPLEICQAWNHPTSPASNSAFDARHVLSFQARVRHQRALEEVYWKHRTWTDSKSVPKPELDEVMPTAQIEAKVRADLEISSALERRNDSITTQQLQAEIYRMASHTKRPQMLR